MDETKQGKALMKCEKRFINGEDLASSFPFEAATFVTMLVQVGKNTDIVHALYEFGALSAFFFEYIGRVFSRHFLIAHQRCLCLSP